ncbi:MAG: hypothetical protein HFI21_13490 [Lachnospiraceae bacterium]|nr:hypothetical protein [Lachnospiraceae bacterium]
MQLNSKILKQKIDEYYKNNISKNELGRWAEEGYYALMKGEYIEIEKLEIYHFLRTISAFHLIPDDKKDEYPCSEEDVVKIREILYGRENTCYTFNVRIYQNLYLEEKYIAKLEEFKGLKEIIDIISLEEVLPLQIDFLIKYGSHKPKEILTLVDLLEENIKDIIIENIDLDEKQLDFIQTVGIYAGGGSKINRQNFLPSLNKLLDCVMGNIIFRISIIYKKGMPYLSIILN